MPVLSSLMRPAIKQLEDVARSNKFELPFSG
jgi:hypothetical protein